MGLGNRTLMNVRSAPALTEIYLGDPDPGYTSFEQQFTDNTNVEYWALDAANWEHGYGLWHQGHNRIERNTVVETLFGGVYNDADPAGFIDLSGGTKVMMAPSLEQWTFEIGDTGLVAAGGDLVLPMENKIFHFVLTEDINLMIDPPPAYPLVSMAEIEFEQDPTGGWTVTFDANWFWANGNAVPVDLTAQARTRYIIAANGRGNEIHIDGSYRRKV